MALQALDLVGLAKVLVGALKPALGVTARPELTLARHNKLLHGRYIIAGGVEYAIVEFESDDGEYDDGEEDEQGDLEQRGHGLDDRVQDDLERGYARDELERAEHAHSAQCAQIEARALARHEYGHEAGDDHGEVHDVPHAPQVRVFVQDKAVGEDFDCGLHAKNT